MLCTYVYLIRVVGTDSYKIGRANNVYVRLSDLQVGSPAELRLEWAELFHPRVELKLHRVLAHRRVRGEWFEIPDIAEFYAAVDSIRATDTNVIPANHVKVVVKDGKRLTRRRPTAPDVIPERASINGLNSAYVFAFMVRQACER